MNIDRDSAYRSAFDQFRRGALDVAIGQMQALSEEGYAPAQCFIGWAHHMGCGKPKLAHEARRWYERAAQADYVPAKYYLGVFLLGEGEEATGADWIARAAEQAYVPAMYRLGLLHEAGLGVPLSEEEAVRCMRQAANLGQPFAERWLALRGVKGRDGVGGFFRGLIWFATVPIRAIKFGMANQDDENMLRS